MRVPLRRRWLNPSLFLIFTLLAGEAGARDKLELGWLERIRLQPWDIVVKAKLDTGAKTAALHATDIERFEKDGEPWVRFRIALDHRDEDGETILVEKPVEREVKIKLRGDRGTATRPTVKLEFCLGGRRYSALFGLVNRSRFIYPVLLGRRYLTDIAMVDPAQTYTTDPVCPKPAEP